MNDDAKNNNDKINASVHHGEASNTSSKKQVLLVDDHEPNTMIARFVMEDLGLDFDVVHSGHDAICKFQENNYSVIVMDVQMPGIDGLETTRRIRQMETEHNLTPAFIIAWTAHHSCKDECFDAGMNDFLPKPFAPEDLTSKISAVIKR
jgi:CheY-like chemotaxis protein